MSVTGPRSKTVPCDVLAVALHIALLEVCGKPMKVLVVRQHGVSFGAMEVDVPDSEDSQNDGDLKREGSIFEDRP